jgi:hypothetical protein
VTSCARLSSLLLAAATAACADLNLTDPNRPTTDTFWRTAADAIAGVNAAYNGLQNNGTYGRWLVFATDLRSDIGMIQSPWTDLSNFTKFTFTSYDFEVNREIWQHHYQTIFRANQVIARVPDIPMDPALRDRIVGEAKFIRALLYYNLVVLYGNVPLITTPPEPTDRPATVGPTELWAQIEQDLTEARAVLPRSYSGADVGRATWGAATALLGKAHLQQREWSEAAAALQAVIDSGPYDLMPNYADNFTDRFENNVESVFEVQFGDRSFLSAGDARAQHRAHGGAVRPELLRWPADALVLPGVPAGYDDRRPGGPAARSDHLLQQARRHGCVRHAVRHPLHRYDRGVLQEVRRVLSRPPRPGLGRRHQLPCDSLRRRAVDAGRGVERAGADVRDVSTGRPCARACEHATAPGWPHAGRDA